MQLASNALNRKVITGPVEATAAGNILGQAIAAGELSGVDAAREVVRNSFELESFEPDAAEAEKYLAALERFCRVTA